VNRREGRDAVPRDCDPRPTSSMSPDRPTPFANGLFDRLRLFPWLNEGKAFFFVLPAPSMFRNIQTPKQASVVLKSTRKENERRKESCKQNLVGILRIGCGVEEII
jgi:hypothetical protein